MNKLFSGTYTIEVVLTGLKTTIPFPLDLKDKRIKHIEIDNEQAISPTGRAVYTGDSRLTLTEQYTKERKVYQLNANEIKTSVNKGNMLFLNKVIDFGQSYVEIGNIGYVGQALLLIVYYDEPSQMNYFPNDATNKTVYDAFELPVLNTSKTRWTFPENNNLRGKKIQQLMLQVGTSTTPEGYTGISGAVAKRAYLTLKKDNYEFVKQFPLYRLYQVGDQWPLRFQNIVFDFTNSYIDFVNMTGITAGQSSVFFNCIVDDNK